MCEEWCVIKQQAYVTSLRQRCHNTRLNGEKTRWTCHRGKLKRRGLQLKLSENRLACCLHTTYYKRPYILQYMRRFYKYMEHSVLFYCGHEENMHEACGRVKGFVTGCDIGIPAHWFQSRIGNPIMHLVVNWPSPSSIQIFLHICSSVCPVLDTAPSSTTLL